MRIWFNKTFSSIHTVLSNICKGDSESEITLICSHTNPHAPGMSMADEKHLEPTDLSDDDYLEWTLEFCQKNAIDWFWPGKAVRLVAENVERFRAIGTEIISVAEPAILALLNDKAAFYNSLSNEIALAPDTIAVNTLAEFDQAFEKLRSKHEQVCIKPAVSVFGLGFRVIDETRFSIDHLLNAVEYQIPLQELRLGMANTSSFATLLVMEYLPGHEWSVDCVAKQGDLWCAVQRKKPKLAGYGQSIDKNADIAGMVERLTNTYRLNALFNIQFKEGVNGPRLLEINARPSGGIGMACQSGINLAKMSIQSLINTKPSAEIGNSIDFGRHVSEINTPIILKAT